MTCVKEDFSKQVFLCLFFLVFLCSAPRWWQQW